MKYLAVLFVIVAGFLFATGEVPNPTKPKPTCVSSLVPGFPILCIQHNPKVIVTPTPGPTPTSSPTPIPTATPTASPTASPTPVPTLSPTPNPTSTPGTVVWQAGDPVLGKWSIANTYQCGTPVANGSSFYFDLKMDGTKCGRNQLLSLDSSGNLLRLEDGHIYTFVFSYIDGNPQDVPPGMGNDDGEAQSVVWQIHGYDEQDTPCTQLGFGNTPPNSSSGQPQQWLMDDCNSSLSNPFWTGTYTPGEQDTFAIEALISSGSNGWLKLWRNGNLVASRTGANYKESTGDPWVNWGVYQWRWELPDGGGSKMTEKSDTINNMIIYKE